MLEIDRGTFFGVLFNVVIVPGKNSRKNFFSKIFLCTNVRRKSFRKKFFFEFFPKTITTLKSTTKYVPLSISRTIDKFWTICEQFEDQNRPKSDLELQIARKSSKICRLSWKSTGIRFLWCFLTC